MSDWKPPRHGPPGSLLRALQRGTGAGYLRALQARPEQVHQMLLSFAEHDPRWDPQIERRTEYWGDLAVAVGLPAEPLAEIALRLDVLDDEGNHDANHYPALAMLGQMAVRGREDALGALLKHAKQGLSWDDALRELEGAGPAAMERAGDALVRRFGGGPELKAALAGVDERWEQFEDLTGPVGEAARAMRNENKSRERTLAEPKPDLAAMTLDELRDHADDWITASDVAEELRRRKTSFDELAGWFRPGRSWVEWHNVRVNGVDKRMAFRRVSHAAPAALQAMRGSAEPALLAACVRIVEAPLRPRAAFRLRPQALQVLREGSATAALPIARRWWSTAPRLRGFALDIFEVHAEPEDIQRIVPVLRMRFTPGTHYLIDGALDALLKHTEHRPFPGLERLYHRAAMSCTRIRAVKLMAATGPEFASGLAFECLWDAEPEIRREAACVVDLELPGARDRLESLATDTNAPDDVRAIARERLARG